MAKKKEEKSKSLSIFKISDMIDKLSDETQIVIENDEKSGTISTSIHILDALLSKSILHGGISDDRISIFAGEQSVGKSYILYNIARNAQKEGYYVIFIDTEHSVSKESLKGFGINTVNDKLKLISSNKVEDLKIFLTKLLDNLKQEKKSGLEIPKIIIFLDSIGQLASNKEVSDALSGENKIDMSRAKAIKQLFRIINSDLGYLSIPLVCTNHVYADTTSFYPVSVMSGGSGAMYSSSAIIFLSAAKLKTGREDDLDLNQTGIIVTAQAKKNRLAKPKKVKFHIDFSYGTNPYTGLEYFCTPENFEKVGIAKGKKIELEDGKIGIEPGGTRWYVRHLDKYFFEKQLFTSTVFTQEVLEALEPIIYKYFDYSSFDEQQQYTSVDNDEVTEVEDNDFDSLDSDELFS
jgi:RecA/RadA recombinase